MLTIVAATGLALAVAALAQAFRAPRERGAISQVALRLARWLIAALLAAAGIWMAISPRADHPLIDAIERAFPAIRSAYMDENEQATMQEAARLSEGYRNEAAKPKAREDLVVLEVRTRARERNRWRIAGVLVLLALSLVVSLPSRRTTPRNFGGERRSTRA